MVIYKKSRVIYHDQEKRVTIWLIFMVIFTNKIMQNYQNNYPKKRGNGNYPWCRGNYQRVIPIYAPEATPATDTDSSRSGMSSMTGVGGFASLNASKMNAVLENYKTNSQDRDLLALMSDLQTAWGLN